MEDTGEAHLKRERPVVYGQPPSLHMPAPEAPTVMHNYHHQTPQPTPMPPSWNPAPSPYHDGSEHRPPNDVTAHQPPPVTYPPQAYPPPAPGQPPAYPPDPAYGRQGSAAGPTRSPPSAHPAHYPPLNGAPHPEGYYQQHDYRQRPPYPPPHPSESPASVPSQSSLHVPTTHEMMPTSAHSQAPPPYAHSQYPAPPGPAQPYWVQPSLPQPDWMVSRRKPVRAAQACDSCRQRKAKCDEGRPLCTHCKENALTCTYRDVPPQKSEKQMLAITDKVDSFADKVDSFGDKVDSLADQFAKQQEINAMQQGKIDKMFQMLSDLHATQENRLPLSVTMTKTRSRAQTKEEPSTDGMGYSSHQVINAPFMQPIDSMTEPVTYPVEPAEKVGKTRGPMGASDLLLWPGIKDLVSSMPHTPPVSYVMDGELERGLLRLYGCGEGEDKGDGHDGALSPSNRSTTSGRMDEDSSTSSPSGVWGTGQLPQREANQQSAFDHPGGVTPSGELLLDKKIVDTCVKSYLDRMHILHPFLDPRVLRKMVHAFKVKHSWDYAITSRLQQSVTGSKRKRETSDSPNSMTDDMQPPAVAVNRSLPRNTQPIEHSVSNAIVLLVIALGKICAWDKPLPGPPKSTTISIPMNTPQPFLGYGDLPPPSSAPASPYTVQPNVNGLTVPSNAVGLQGKNMDIIPGLAYFAKAADILGELPGGVDASHVQANLLAGLYMGQLARVIPSHWYISNACKACQILIRSTEYKEGTMGAEQRNLINFAFWSCLQLESDILAELDIPSSGIVHKEASMLAEIPTALTIADPEKDEGPRNNPQEFLRHYSNQIQLRRTINDAVHNIYNAEREQDKPTRLIETICENLENWRALLKDWNWNEDEHESPDINHARMRGKYYGAKYIINRPALHYALAFTHPATPASHTSESPIGRVAHSEHSSPAVTHYGKAVPARRVSEMRPPARTPEQLEDWILQACQACVEAAIKSTTAFDAVPKRLVITNILGTAHAQFGNVLVLAATFSSTNPQLHNMVPEEILRKLLVRTINFLDDKAGISPALAKDAEILRHVQKRIFPSTANNLVPVLSAYSSFSSQR